MRGLALAAVLLFGGCQLLVGIDDPLGDECSPFDIDTCDLTDTCDIDPDTLLLTCRREGLKQRGELCDGLDDCAGPLSCANGVCRAFCPVFGQDCPDPLEGSCVIQWGLNAQVCDSACQPHLAGTCGPQTECILTTNDGGTPVSTCVPFGYYGDVPVGGDCTFLAECAEGAACDDLEGDGGICTPLCDVNADDCAVGTTCTARFDTIHDDLQLGFCL